MAKHPQHTEGGKTKYPGPFLNGPALSTADICYIAYATRDSQTTTVNIVCQPDITTTQMNDAFAGNYDPAGGFVARFPGYTAPANVQAAVTAYNTWKGGK